MKWFRRNRAPAPSSEPPGPGLHNPEMIDLITDGGDHVRLIMVASGEWFEAGRPLLALQRKLETYATYVASGALHTQYPHVKGKRAEIVLHYPDEPDAELIDALERARPALSQLGITVALEVLPELREPGPASD